MQHQHTIREPITVSGLEPYGGNTVDIEINPADEDTGIIFETPRGSIKADIDHASQKRSSITLSNGRVELSVVEHFLATLYAYGIDNATISIHQRPSRSYRILQISGLANKASVLPTLPDRQRTLCERLEEVGTKQQTKTRRVKRITNPIHTKRLQFEPIEGDDLLITAITDYPIPGEERHTLTVTPNNYREQVAASRAHMKHLKYIPRFVPDAFISVATSLAYPSFGVGHGYDEKTFFLPPKTLKEWREAEIYQEEIARHTIVDRLGAIALLGERLEGVHITTRFSGHRNDIDVLKKYFRQ